MASPMPLNTPSPSAGPNAAPQLNLHATTQAKMKEAARKFEAYFVFQTLELITPKPEEGGLFSGGTTGSFGEQMFRHELNEQMAQAITKRGGFGVADAVYRTMLQQQEARQ